MGRDVLGLVLHPAGGGEVLRQLDLRRGARHQRGIEGDGAGGGRALIEGEQDGQVLFRRMNFPPDPLTQHPCDT